MIDITHKYNTLREATAKAVVKVGNSKTIKTIQNGSVPKGNLFEMSRAAGLLAIKKTPEILPDCHPIPIEFADFKFEIKDLEIHIMCTIKTIYKTGVEVEAMHGVSVVALNMYDMLKPIDKNIEIFKIKLESKSGGKSNISLPKGLINAAVIVCSDSISNGKNKDKAGKAIIESLKKWKISTVDYSIIRDDINEIQKKTISLSKNNVPLIILTGGTGLSPKDLTPEALLPILERRIPGVEEAIRNFGQNRTPYSMLSRSVVGLIRNSLILALPGSTKGSIESIQAIFPSILHLFDILKEKPH
jgi:molybdenum cofactor biosynthesis protein MoaC